MFSSMAVAIMAAAKVNAKVKKNRKLAASQMSEPKISDCRLATLF